MKKLSILLTTCLIFLITIGNFSAEEFSFRTNLESDYSNSELKKQTVNQNITLSKDYQQMATNDYLSLYVDESTARIALYDKNADYYWFSSPENLKGNNNDLWISKISSPVEIVYFDSALNEVESALLQEGNSYKINKSDNGFTISCVFQEEIKFDVIFSIDGTKLNVDIPASSIVNGETIFLSKISIMPYFGSSYYDDISGYFALSSGVGNLYNFKDSSYKQFSSYYENVGTNDPSFDDDLDLLSDLSMPLYGIVHGHLDQGVSSYVTSGNTSAALYFKPAGVINGYNQIGWIFNYSTPYYLNLSGNKTLKQASEFNSYDASITYDFLNGEDASYVGVAKSYRNHLEDNYNLSESEYEYDTNLVYAMSSMERAFLGVKNVHQTDYSDIKNNLEYLISENVDTSVTLSSYMDGKDNTVYVYNDRDHVEDYDDLEKGEFSEFLESSGIDLSYELDLYAADSSSSKFRASKNASKLLSGDYLVDRNDFYYTNISDLVNNLDIEDIYKTLNSENVTLYLPTYITSLNHIDARNDYIANAIELLSKFSGTTRSYYYNYPEISTSSSELTGIKFYGSSYSLFDETVPMLPLVFSGSMPMYSTDLSYEIINDDLMLKLVEYDIYPTYYLIGKDYSELDVSRSSYKPFDTLKSDIVEFNSFAFEAFDVIKNAQMISHQLYDTNVTKVVYDNGVEIIFNYNNTDYDYNGSTIDAKSYKIIKGGSNG